MIKSQLVFLRRLRVSEAVLLAFLATMRHYRALRFVPNVPRDSNVPWLTKIPSRVTQAHTHMLVLQAV
jgi:hypothetical protein